MSYALDILLFDFLMEILPLNILNKAWEIYRKYIKFSTMCKVMCVEVIVNCIISVNNLIVTFNIIVSTEWLDC